jgi:hypothetical protein
VIQTWRTLVLDVRTGLFIPRLVTWDPETGEFTRVEGAKMIRVAATQKEESR